MKKIIVFDFDGVIHSYKSGWKGIANIPDAPVEGVFELLTNLVLSDEYEVQILSSRSSKWRGRRAIKKWLGTNLYVALTQADKHPSEQWHKMWEWRIISSYQSMEPWEEHLLGAVDSFIKKIKLPKVKPSAYLTIDDRCICFNGNPKAIMSEIKNFKVWY